LLLLVLVLVRRPVEPLLVRLNPAFTSSITNSWSDDNSVELSKLVVSIGTLVVVVLVSPPGSVAGVRLSSTLFPVVNVADEEKEGDEEEEEGAGAAEEEEADDELLSPVRGEAN
jgi:hypothetical protein